MMTGFGVTEKPKALGFPWWTEAEKYGLNSQVLICEERVVRFCLGRKWWWGVSDAQQGTGMGTPEPAARAALLTPRSPTPHRSPQNLLTWETWAGGRVLLQRCGFRLFGLPLFCPWEREEKVRAGDKCRRSRLGKLSPVVLRLGPHLWTAEVIISQKGR